MGIMPGTSILISAVLFANGRAMQRHQCALNMDLDRLPVFSKAKQSMTV